MSNTLSPVDAAAVNFIDDLLAILNTTAMCVGYIVLAVLLSGLFWFISIRLEAWRYNRRRKRRHDIEWDNLRSAWIFDMHQDKHVRVDTDVLNFTVEQIYDYQKEYGK